MVRSCVLLLAASAAPALGQVTLNASINVDNEFAAYVSTSPVLQGTNFLAGDSWPVTYTGNYLFPGAGTYYLHVRATDTGQPAMFIGSFTLSNASGSTFANGDTVMLTGQPGWAVSNAGFGVGVTAPLDLGVNGSGVWGVQNAQFPGAHYIWAPQYTSTVYFTTMITVTPAPGAAALLGVAGMVTARRRR